MPAKQKSRALVPETGCTEQSRAVLNWGNKPHPMPAGARNALTAEILAERAARMLDQAGR
jgi:hypothetical protein